MFDKIQMIMMMKTSISKNRTLRLKNTEIWTFSIFFIFTIVFPLEPGIRLYYSSITITTDTAPAQMCSCRIQKWIYVVNHNSWTLKFDNFSNFQNSLPVTNERQYDAWRTKIDVWLTHYSWLLQYLSINTSISYCTKNEVFH